VVAATRLRGGNAASVRGAASLACGAIATARACGCTGLVIVRMDSAYYAGEVIAAIRRQGARFSVTAPSNSRVKAAIAGIDEAARAPVRYPRALRDDQLGCLVSEAEVAETEHTAFEQGSQGAVTARLIVRRVRDQNKRAAEGMGELFPVWRYHAVFTDSPFETVQAEAGHRDHAIIERSPPTSTTAPSPTCPPGSPAPTPPGCPSPPSPATCCAPPAPSPAAPSPKPAAPPSAATWSPSPPAPPGTAAAASPSTSPKTGTAPANG